MTRRREGRGTGRERGLRGLAAGVLVLLGLLAAPSPALACPVCFNPTEETRLAFLHTTIALTLLPLILVGGAGLWLRRRARRMEEEEGVGYSGRGDGKRIRGTHHR